jgi:hypothetical protein
MDTPETPIPILTSPASSTKLKFAELQPGDKFITFPVDGDNTGSGGYRSPYPMFIKISPLANGDPSTPYNATRLQAGTALHVQEDMEVVRIVW